MKNLKIFAILLCFIILLCACSQNFEKVSLDWNKGEETMLKEGGFAPRVYTLENGRMIAGYETVHGILTKVSDDNGKTWNLESKASFCPAFNCANVNFFQKGRSLYMAYRATGKTEKGYYTSLQVSVSTDNGENWKKHSLISEALDENGNLHGVWEPFLGLLNDELVCFYANDSRLVTKYQNIEYKVFKNGEWKNRTVISEGEKHLSRDGMPVFTRLKSGEYVCVIESSKYANEGNPFVLQMFWSKDGKHWSEPVDVYRPAANGSKAAAPGIVQLPSGQIVISFQTDEDSGEKGDSFSVMKTIYTDIEALEQISAASFSKPQKVFSGDDGLSVWTGLWYSDKALFAAAGTKKGAELKRLELW